MQVNNFRENHASRKYHQRYLYSSSRSLFDCMIGFQTNQLVRIILFKFIFDSPSTPSGKNTIQVHGCHGKPPLLPTIQMNTPLTNWHRNLLNQHEPTQVWFYTESFTAPVIAEICSLAEHNSNVTQLNFIRKLE